MSKNKIQVVAEGKNLGLDALDAIVVAVAAEKKEWKAAIPKGFTASERAAFLQLTQREPLAFEAGKCLTFHRSPLQTWIFPVLDEKADRFTLLGFAKDVLKPLKDAQSQKILLDLNGLSPARTLAWVDAFVAAQVALGFQAPRYKIKAKDEPKPFQPQLTIVIAAKSQVEAVSEIAGRSAAASEAGNTVRELAMLAGNDLTPHGYVERIRKEAAKERLAFEFFDVKKLQQLKAGAFLAVAQGSAHNDAGIIKLSYSPKSKKHLCLVGKGVTFDTGGTNLKPAAYMYGMHRDMTGSALAYALIRLAAREKWPCRVTAYLAIADNATGPKAYRPNDVVTAMNGKTIEIVHTDAEGRMMLADTLFLASKDKPDLLLDFATLTGACVHAIGSTYSGAFTNRDEFHEMIIRSGREAGERVWPFPMDQDFGDCLKSDTADTKQCRLTGGVDHIEAAIFLKSFLAHDLPWIHLDLASADHSGGLAHVDTEVTGFGARFTLSLLRNLWPETL